jgi:hypothetical protein
MFQIGPSLREARSRRGLSPADVHKAIRIRERYLAALEEERWETLPGDAYAKGFLRTYAEFLGLNSQLYIDEFNARVAAHDEEPLVPETLTRTRGASSILFRTIGAVLLVAAAGAVLGLVAWGRGGTERPHIASAGAARVVHVHRAQPTAHATKPVAAPKPTFTIIRAATDQSWLDVRLGGPSGKELFRGILAQGGRLKYGLRTPVWVRMGRPRALDIRIGATAVRNLPADPADLLLRSSGPSTP